MSAIASTPHKEQMVVSAIASTPHHFSTAIASTPHKFISACLKKAA
ncbi:hypothetical protein Asd1617_00456 [Shigella dysenteriae 1617]|uniref:Uncharacterized protein n=1 Tax=Shigella dysenteriae 1617 TaxID=754093 RepID=A0A0A6ZML6_SHIDY|nr:hypothetical protein Asd1617_00456 [Shigella dysenteriae 1617]